jgi:formate C-acetyltransferase
VLLKPDADEEFTQKTFEALSVLTDKMNIYNYDLISKALINKGIEEAVAKDFTYSACCTLDLNYHSFRRQYFVPVPHILLKTLENGEYNSLESFLDAFRELLRIDMQNYADREKQRFSKDEQRRRFVLDSILLSDSAIECRYACDGNAKYDVLNLFCPGIATVGDSLMVLDKLVYKEKRYTYGELVQILKEDFSNHGNLRSEILSYTKFGNDTDVDTYAVMAGEAFLDAVDSLELNDNFYAVGSFYSLERDNTARHNLGATPDGRKSGAPFSENQSPTYGTDKLGITALLNSVAKLPLSRTGAGGLNLTFSQCTSSDILKALILSYFQIGGLHVGISVINRDMLLDAMNQPDKYKSLTVRLYGFSEYFVSLPEWQQLAILNRTEYCM